MIDFFTKHPRCMGETYLQHFVCAVRFSMKMLFGGIACLIHAVFPFLFQKTGSNLLFKMLHDFIDRTPHVEERTLTLADAINKKLNKYPEK